MKPNGKFNMNWPGGGERDIDIGRFGVPVA